jgi:hypothetical protein
LAGDAVTVELRYGELDPIAETFTLGDELPQGWSPEGAQMAAAAAAAAATAAAEPEPEPPMTFTVLSNPVGARVTFDGEVLDERTPVDIDVDLGEEHTVVVELDDHESRSWRFSRDDLSQQHLESGELMFVLEPSIPPGFLSIDNPGYPVAVSATPMAGGRTVTSPAATSHEIRLAPGRYRVTLSAPSVYWQGETRTVTVASEEALPIANLPRAVQVQVAAVPGNCTVSINGREVGPTPFGVQIVVGTHDFHFDWSALGRGTKDVSVRIDSNGQRVVEEAGDRP